MPPQTSVVRLVWCVINRLHQSCFLTRSEPPCKHGPGPEARRSALFSERRSFCSRVRRSRNGFASRGPPYNCGANVFWPCARKGCRKTRLVRVAFLRFPTIRSPPLWRPRCTVALDREVSPGTSTTDTKVSPTPSSNSARAARVRPFPRGNYSQGGFK